jgi:hypothetical protein
MSRTIFVTACRWAGAEKGAKQGGTLVLRFLLQTSLIASLLLFGSARADDESLVGGHDQPNRKEQPNRIKQTAQKPAKSNKPAKQATQKAAQKVRQATDAEREEAALAFVREHHPDLVDLLKRLKGTKENEYRQAIKELSRDSKRIDALRDRDPDRYKLELRAWQLDSGIRLLAAKLSLEDRPEWQEDLKVALAERADVRLAQLKLERKRVTARLKKLDAEIDNFASQREASLKRNFDRLMGTAEKARGRAKSLEKK